MGGIDLDPASNAMAQVMASARLSGCVRAG
jgi:hypothetical protein